MGRFLSVLIVAVVAALALPPLLQSYVDSQGQKERIQTAGTGKKAGEISIPRNRMGQFEARVYLNNTSVNALIDTGASLLALPMSVARQIGHEPSPVAFRHRIKTANGTVRAALIHIDVLELGPLEVRNVEAAVLPDGALSVVLVGMSVLERFDEFTINDDGLLLSLR
ncbi:TIGR02281 family clan AA aspartic protease [Rhodobacteraceae bacterium RKSG542]|uniref:retropepsin-like aspartic protease family protein n=1 Tax=Pseudovibrio flavus TaxID=2529854 RepID=UPI0012BB6974|nr:TIGR02281 family clan AA aspartic protease [Pseudovibrio flavus]MTI17199.1 TIGR02281 family clan AA aspartic protease [Pseudovibrio flavus]